MDWIEALIIGIVQGLTEFLPVSSSGHIEIAQKILSADDLKAQEELLSVVLHFATALSTIVIFRKDIMSLFLGLFKGNKKDFNFSLAIIISMIPAAIVGLTFDDLIASLFEGNLILVGSMLLITALLLIFASKAKSTLKQEVSFFNALVIGISQAVAILPGISRSGATISTSVLLGIDKALSARFSFLMVVPLILGKMAKDIIDGKLVMQEELILPFCFGFIGAFITGLLACLWMIAIVKKSKLSYFSVYCAVVGSIAICWTLFK